LRNLISDRLQGKSQGGRDDSVRRIGVRVEEAFVTDFEPNTAYDRNVLQMYQLVEKARRELIEAQENKERDRVLAVSLAQQGAILNIAPSILALEKSPVGKVLIERDANLRELMVNAGLLLGMDMALQNPGKPPILPSPAMSGYLQPPQLGT